MSPWKVILATIIIFGAGVLTGSLIPHRPLQPKLVKPAPSAGSMDNIVPQPWFVRKEYLGRLDQKLNLSPAQRERIAHYLEESQERTRSLMLLIGPELQEELITVRAKIRAELTPEQQKRFEEMIQRGRGGRSGPRSSDRQHGTNAPTAPEPAPAK